MGPESNTENKQFPSVHYSIHKIIIRFPKGIHDILQLSKKHEQMRLNEPR